MSATLWLMRKCLEAAKADDGYNVSVDTGVNLDCCFATMTYRNSDREVVAMGDDPEEALLALLNKLGEEEA